MIAMKKLTEDDVKKLQLDIMDDVHDFCENNGIKYSLCGGSLLGAVRHHGYIPWDDDIDIMMARPDFEKFISEYISDKSYLKIDYYRNNPHYVGAFAKVIDLRTSAEGPNIIDDRHVFIDIFPIDSMPSENEIDGYIEKIREVLTTLRKTGKYYLYASSFLEQVMFYIKYVLKTISLPSRNKCFARLEEIIGAYPYGSTPFAGVSVGQYAKKEWMPKHIFENFQLMDFEGRKYSWISEYDKYLKCLYKDYMTLPPEEQRIGSHFENVWME